MDLSLRADGPGTAAVLPVAVLALGCSVVLAAMWWAWRRHAKRDLDIDAPASLKPAPALVGPYPATYVSTTRAGWPLARVHSHTLGARSRALISLTDGGDINIEREGAQSFSIPSQAISGIRPAAAMAGKAIGGNGLLVLTHRLGAHDLDTGLRMATRHDHNQLLSVLSTRLEEAQ